MVEAKNAPKWYATAQKMVEEGTVLLKNDNKVLPFKNDKVAVFGAAQMESGKVSVTGNNITSALIENGCAVDEELYARYKGNAKAEKRYRTNTPVTLIDKEIQFEDGEIQAIKDKGATAAIIVLSRQSGENEDVKVEEGGYDLSRYEEKLIKDVSKVFDKVVLILSLVGNIDLGFMNETKIDAVLYVSKLYNMGSEAVARILCGDVNPSGKMTFTMAKHLEDYPSTKNFGEHGGGLVQDYREDIFVGYRYFDTFKKHDNVLYPFGFGMSYTTFDIKPTVFESGSEIKVGVEVTNTGDCAGKEVVQLYYAPPRMEKGAKLGRPMQELCGFDKTKLLQPGETQYIEIKVKADDMAAYDDLGVLGESSVWVMEKGEYELLVGNSSVSTVSAGVYTEAETRIIRKCPSIATALEERLIEDGSFEKLPGADKAALYDAVISAGSRNVIPVSLASVPFESLKIGDETTINVLPGSGGVYSLRFEGDTSKKIEDMIELWLKVDNTDYHNQVKVDLETDEKGLAYVTLPMILTTLSITAKCDAPDISALIFEKVDTTVKVEKDKRTVVGGQNYFECSYGLQIRSENEKSGDVVDYLTWFHATGNNATYRLDVEEGGLYDISFRCRYFGEPEKIGTLMSVAVSNISQPLDGAMVEKTCDSDGDIVFGYTKPVTIELPKGIVYLKFVVEKRPFPDMAEIVLEKSKSGVNVSAAAAAENSAEAVVNVPLTGGAQIDPDDGVREGIILRDVYENPELMQAFLDQLSNRELATIVSGTGLNKNAHSTVGCNHPLFVRGVPAAQTSDGSNGLYQRGIETVVYSAPILLASSFSRELLEEYGNAIGEECVEDDVDIWLAPAINIFRNPCGGRNYTYASEDPYVSAVYAIEQTKAVQKHGVVTMVKHYCANNTEYERLKSNSRVSERALREIYMKAFELTVKEANPWAIMSSYNSANNIKVCEDSQLITDIPRGEWHWDGVFATDWWNDSNHVRELKAGHDLKMATGDIDGVTAALDSGELTREQVCVCAERVLKMLMKIKTVKEFFEKEER